MAKSFSVTEMVEIKQNLQKACEESWRLRGYKQTNIPLLTKTVGISAGSFYLIYTRKEDLFLEVLGIVQKNLLASWTHFLAESDQKIDGLKKGLRWLFDEYRTYPNLYDVNTPEYDLFLNKLPQERVEQLRTSSRDIFRQVIKQSKLKLLLNEEEVIDIIHSILFLSLVKGDTLKGTEKTFDFLLEHTLNNLFEEER